jgi:hypothetical protein
LMSNVKSVLRGIVGKRTIVYPDKYFVDQHDD